MSKRFITGPILVFVLLGVILLDGWLDTVQLRGVWQDMLLGRTHPPRGLVLFIGCVAVAALAARDLSNMSEAAGIKTKSWLTAVAAVAGLAMCYVLPLLGTTSTILAVVATTMIVVFIAALLTFSRHRNFEGVLAAAGAVVFAMVYLGFMLGFFLMLRRDHSTWWIVGIILATKSCDIGAYLTGRAIGRHKLIPWLSPGKTWEGLVGGVITAAIIGIGLAAASGLLNSPSDHIPIGVGAIAGIVFAIVGQFGDLAVSLFKRDAGVKDSSSLLPGMGGVLDVLDSPLMVAPVAYWLLTVAVGPGT